MAVAGPVTASYAATVSHDDPHQAVIECVTRLSEPRGQRRKHWWRQWLGLDLPWRQRPRTWLGYGPPRVIAEFGGPPGHQADPDSIRIVKERAIPGRRLYRISAIERRSHARQLYDQGTAPWLVVPIVLRLPRRPELSLWVGAREQPEGGWMPDGMAGGGAGDPPWAEPRVNLCGWGWPDRFAGGGRVIAQGRGVTRVRLRFANGVELEDSVDDGEVLFLTDEHAEVPATVSLYDTEGALVASHDAFAPPQLSPEELDRLTDGLPPEAAAELRRRFGRPAD